MIMSRFWTRGDLCDEGHSFRGSQSSTLVYNTFGSGRYQFEHLDHLKYLFGFKEMEFSHLSVWHLIHCVILFAMLQACSRGYYPNLVLL